MHSDFFVQAAKITRVAPRYYTPYGRVAVNLARPTEKASGPKCKHELPGFRVTLLPEVHSRIIARLYQAARRFAASRAALAGAGNSHRGRPSTYHFLRDGLFRPHAR